LFRRFKHSDDDPIANQLSALAEPNTLTLGKVPAKPAQPTKSGKSGKSGKSAKSAKSAKSGKAGAKTPEWTPDVVDEDLEPFEEELDETDEDEEEEEEDDRTPEQRRADLEAELQRQAEEYGLTNLSPETLYGPNGEAVASLLDSLGEIDDELAEAIADAFDAVPEPERKVARSGLRRRARSAKLDSEIDAAEGAVNDWLSALSVRYEDESLYTTVAEAARDAVDALVMEEELDDADFATLYGPWSDVMDVEDDVDGEGDGEADESPSVADTAAARGAAEPEGEEEVGEFGPNTPLVIEFLTKLGSLSTPEIAEIVAAWREQPKGELRTAHRNLQELADEDHSWRDQLRHAQEEVFGWMAADDSRFYERSAVSKDDLRAREVAGPAIADAVAAIAMADMLEPEDSAALYAAWAEVIGEPVLPTFEEEEGDAEDGDEDEKD
jgi:hypothetical protein